MAVESPLAGAMACTSSVPTGAVDAESPPGNTSTRVGGWSPDGRFIAYESGGTWIVEADGTNPRRLSPTSVPVAWSPDSRSILGVRDPYSYAPTIVVIAADGSGERSLGPGRQPTWSPGGAEIAFVHAGEIGRSAPDGSGRRLLTRTTAEPGRNAIELRATATGRVLSAFNTDGLPSEVALAGARVALLYQKPEKLEIRSVNGSLLRQVSVAAAQNLSLAGRWTVYRTGRTIRALEVQSGRAMIVARAAVVPVGLSLDGRRVAWAEQPGAPAASGRSFSYENAAVLTPALPRFGAPDARWRS
jgi:hypothetical protein